MKEWMCVSIYSIRLSFSLLISIRMCLSLSLSSPSLSPSLPLSLSLSRLHRRSYFHTKKISAAGVRWQAGEALRASYSAPRLTRSTSCARLAPRARGGVEVIVPSELALPSSRPMDSRPDAGELRICPQTPIHQI